MSAGNSVCRQTEDNEMSDDANRKTFDWVDSYAAEVNKRGGEQIACGSFQSHGDLCAWLVSTVLGIGGEEEIDIKIYRMMVSEEVDLDDEDDDISIAITIAGEEEPRAADSSLDDDCRIVQVLGVSRFLSVNDPGRIHSSGWRDIIGIADCGL